MLDKREYNEMIAARIARAARLAERRGFQVERTPVYLNLTVGDSTASLLFRSDHIVLEEIKVSLEERRHRRGSDILNVAVAIADQAELRIELIAESPLRPHALDLNQSDLQAWYRRYRFVDVNDVLMSRLPNKPSASVPL